MSKIGELKKCLLALKESIGGYYAGDANYSWQVVRIDLAQFDEAIDPAIDEINMLRAALEKICNIGDDPFTDAVDDLIECREIARAALKAGQA
jgi:hypothetical protein